MNSFGSAVVAVLAFCTLLSAVEGHKCSPGFHAHGSSCYWFSTVKGTFGFARSVCEYLGSHLAIITSRSEDDFLRGYAKQRGKGVQYYLGGSDLGLEGWWRWEGGRPLTYKNWGGGEPNNLDGTEHCLTLYKKKDYRWNDSVCDNNENFICESSA